MSAGNRYNGQQNMVTISPDRKLPVVRAMSAAESAALQEFTAPMQRQAPIQIPALPNTTHSSHLRENYDMRAMADVATRFGAQDALIIGAITLAITILLAYFVPFNNTIYGLGWLLLWGGISLFSLNRTRLMAYDHSPVGVARFEQQSQMAMHDRTAQTEEYRIDSNERIAMAELQHRRELGQAYLNRLEGKNNE